MKMLIDTGETPDIWYPGHHDCSNFRGHEWQTLQGESTEFCRHCV